MIFKNFKTYVPDTESTKALVELGVLFSRDEDGNDWYDCLNKFPEDSFKMIINKDGVIVAYSKVAGSLPMIPDGYSVADSKFLPKDFTNNMTFIYDEKTGKVKTREYSVEEVKVQVDKKKASLMEQILTTINPLQFAVDLDMATEEEQVRLKSLQKYVVMLNRVSLQDTYPTGVVWPDLPTT